MLVCFSRENYVAMRRNLPLLQSPPVAVIKYFLRIIINLRYQAKLNIATHGYCKSASKFGRFRAESSQVNTQRYTFPKRISNNLTCHEVFLKHHVYSLKSSYWSSNLMMLRFTIYGFCELSVDAIELTLQFLMPFFPLSIIQSTIN